MRKSSRSTCKYNSNPRLGTPWCRSPQSNPCSVAPTVMSAPGLLALRAIALDGSPLPGASSRRTTSSAAGKAAFAIDGHGSKGNEKVCPRVRQNLSPNGYVIDNKDKIGALSGLCSGGVGSPVRASPRSGQKLTKTKRKQKQKERKTKNKPISGGPYTRDSGKSTNINIYAGPGSDQCARGSGVLFALSVFLSV